MSSAPNFNNAETAWNAELSESQLKFFCETIERLAGISMKASKQDLVRTRLRARLHATGLQSYEEYQDYLTSLPRDHAEWQEFINLLTTNKTDFFREPKHFEFIVETLLPQWLKSSEKTLKIWSAASSTGEEAYTLSMVLNRHMPQGRDFKILATDIDTQVIETGKNAVYANSKLIEIPEDYQQECIDIGSGKAKGWFRIKPALKDKVVFKQHNLMEKTSPGENLFDLVLCRNVLIYFNKQGIEFVSSKLFSTTKPGGYFFTGHSESLQAIQHKWDSVAPAVYRKK